MVAVEVEHARAPVFVQAIHEAAAVEAVLAVLRLEHIRRHREAVALGEVEAVDRIHRPHLLVHHRAPLQAMAEESRPAPGQDLAVVHVAAEADSTLLL